MALKYCLHCERPVEAKRNIGIGSLILIFITGGFWIIILLFYSKRCPICKGTTFGYPAKIRTVNIQDNSTPISDSKPDPMDQIKKLQALKESGALTELEFNEKKKKILDTI